MQVVHNIYLLLVSNPPCTGVRHLDIARYNKLLEVYAFIITRERYLALITYVMLCIYLYY